MDRLDWIIWSVGGLLAAGGVVLLVRALWWDRARGRKRCPGCWYDMSGAGAVAFDVRTREPRDFRCTECGRVTSGERRLLKTRRRWGRATAGAAALLLAYGVLIGQGVIGGWKARKLNAIPHPLTRLVLWTCCAFDGADQEPSPSYAGSPGISLRSAIKKTGVQTIGAQWNDLIAAYRWSGALERAPAGPAEGSGPSADECFTELANLGAEGWPAVGVLVEAIEGRIPRGGSGAERAAASASAMWALKCIGPEASGAVPVLRERALRSNSSNVPEIIATMVAVSPRPAEAIASLLDGSAEWTAICALEELRRMGPNGAEGARAVARLARGGRTVTMRVYAIGTLRAIAPRRESTVRELVECLGDPDSSVQTGAATTLGYWSPEAIPAVPALCACARTTANPTARLTAAFAVASLAPATPEAVELTAWIAEREDVPARVWAVQTLGSWGLDAATAADRIRPLLNADSEYLRACTAAALAAMDGERARGERREPAEFDGRGAEERR